MYVFKLFVLIILWKPHFHSNDKEDVVKNSQKIMLRLLIVQKNLGVTDIVIPCVDQSSLVDQNTINRFVKNLTQYSNYLKNIVLTFLLRQT